MSEENKKAGAAKAPANPKEQAPEKSERELALEKELEKAKKVIEAQANTIKIQEVEKSSKKHPIKTIEGVHYRFLGKGNININGTLTSCEDILKDDVLCKAMIAKGSGLFVKFKGKSKKGGKK